LTDKHIGRKRKYDDDYVGLRRDLDSDDEEWAHITAGIGEKLEITDIMDVQDRSITFNQNESVPTKEEDYKIQNETFKDKFSDTAQYLKFVNAHLAEKQLKLDKIKEQRENFEKEIAKLKPDGQRSKSDLDLLNYKEIKSTDVRKVLENIEREREQAQSRVHHFSSKLKLANHDLLTKTKQIDDVKLELSSIKNSEAVQPNEMTKDRDAMKSIHKELSSLKKSRETEKIYGAINSLVVLLNTKNQDTVNELNSIKAEFNKMKQEYEKVIQNLNKK